MSQPTDSRDALIERLRTPPTLDRDTPPISAQLRSQPEDFRVTELPAYAPSGEGEHLYLLVEKQGLNTQDAVRRIAQELEVDPRAAGWAGLKDRHATTTQWISLHAPPSVEVEAGRTFGEGLCVREVSRHGNKLRTGHLLGNRFALRLTGIAEERDQDVAHVLERIAREGMPNYFGEQRFGHAGRNLHDALAWLVEGGRAPRSPFARKLMMSTWQSAIFNQVLAERVEAATLGSALVGDLMRKEPAGGQFVCEAPEIDQPRLDSWEISPSGPMFGAKMRQADADVAQQEIRALEAWGGSPDLLARHKRVGEGTRRALRVRPEGLEQRREGADLWLEFTLPSGSYATVLVRELTKAPLWEAAA